MADPATLLDLIAHDFAVTIDPDSDTGQALNALTPPVPNALAGQATIAPLTFVSTGHRISVRAAKAQDAVVIILQGGSLDYTIDLSMVTVISQGLGHIN